MAIEVERLVATLEAKIDKYEKNLAKAYGVTDRQFKRIETRGKQMESRLSQVGANAGLATGKGFAIAGSLRGAQQLLDSSTRITNSLKVAGLEGTELSGVYDKLYDSAQRNAAPLESMVTLYGRLSQSQDELGATTTDLLQFTEGIGQALRVAGTDAGAASGALLQLSQAMGSSIVRAEEFNSINEGARPILQAVAIGMDRARGSVSRLRELVLEGAVTNKEFFQSFLAGMPSLAAQLEGSSLTISQGMTLIGNALIDVTREFDAASGAAGSAGSVLGDLAAAIGIVAEAIRANKEPIEAFFGILEGDHNESIRQFREDLLLAVGAIKEVSGPTRDAREALANFVDLLPSLAANGDYIITPNQIDSLKAIVQPLRDGTGEAEDALTALEDLWSTNPDLGNVLGELGALISQLGAVSTAAKQVTIDLGSMPSFGAMEGFRRGPQVTTDLGTFPSLNEKPETYSSLADFRGKPEKPKGGAGRGGGGGTSKAEGFQESLDDQQRRIDNLKEETAAQALLNPLVDDYGRAMEELRVRQDLLNEAERAGITLTPALTESINSLAAGYANASVEAAKLAESQDQSRQMADDIKGAAEDAFTGFIDDIRSGTSAAEALGNALGKIGDKLLDIALNSIFDNLFGGGGGGGGGIGGFISSIFGGKRENGGPVSSGKAYVVGEKRPELFVPSTAGRIIPKVPGAGGGGRSMSVAPTYNIDARGAQAGVADQIISAIKANNRQLPSLMADIQMRQ